MCGGGQVEERRAWWKRGVPIVVGNEGWRQRGVGGRWECSWGVGQEEGALKHNGKAATQMCGK